MRNGRYLILGAGGVLLVALFIVAVYSRNALDGSDGRIFVLSGRGISNVKISVNGEPAESGGLITMFIVRGKNELVVRGDIEDDYEILFGKTDAKTLMGQWEPLWEIKERAKVPETNKVFRFSFTAKTPQTWAWEKADAIGTLSEQDKKEIMRLFDEIVAATTNISLPGQTVWAKLSDPNTTMPWAGKFNDQARTKEGLTNILSKIRDYQGLTARSSAHEDLVFDVGRKLVALRSKGGDLYYLGHADDYKPKNGEMVWSLKSDVMHFARFGGKWKYLSVRTN